MFGDGEWFRGSPLAQGVSSLYTETGDSELSLGLRYVYLIIANSRATSVLGAIHETHLSTVKRESSRETLPRTIKGVKRLHRYFRVSPIQCGSFTVTQ